MTIPLGDYAQVSDKLCVCYFGNKIDVAELLHEARVDIEEQYPGIEIHYSFRDQLLDRLDYLLEEEGIVPQSKLKVKRREFAYILDITRNDMNEFFSELGMKERYEART